MEKPARRNAGSRNVFAMLAAVVAPCAFSGACGSTTTEPPGEPPGEEMPPVLKIGVLGVMSGPNASWGLVNRYCAEVTAGMYNDEGGVEIDGVNYRIEIITIDDQNDPELAVAGARELTEEGIKYIIGPNSGGPAQAIVPVLEEAGAMNVAYAFPRELYTPPASNSILGMIASYQSAPVIYYLLREHHGIATIAFVARNEPGPLDQRDESVGAAELMGFEVLSATETYEPNTTDFVPVMSPVVDLDPDLIVLSGVAPAHAPLAIKAARELGYGGLMSTETGQDAKILSEVAGDVANGFISPGGAYTSEIADTYMQDFHAAYIEHVGEWNDEAGTKVYALEMLLETLKFAGAEAIEDIEVFKAAMPGFEVENRLMKGVNSLRYVGNSFFQQPRQFSLPLIVNEFRDGEFHTRFVVFFEERGPILADALEF